MKKKLLGSASSGYSLLELIATVTILVALATVMLPSITVNKSSIYTSTEAYNLSGTQRYLEMFNSLYKSTTGTLGAYNAYPTAFSTGLNANTIASPAPAAGKLSLDTLMLLSNQTVTAVASGLLSANVDSSGDTTVVSVPDWSLIPALGRPTALSTGSAISLFKAGITSLNYGAAGTLDLTNTVSFAGGLGAFDFTLVVNPLTFKTALFNLGGLTGVYASQFLATSVADITTGNTFDYANGTRLTAGTSFATLLGHKGSTWQSMCNAATDMITYFFVTPALSWGNYHADAQALNTAGTPAVAVFSYQTTKSSMVEVPVPATSPWMPSTSYRYYIAVFDVDGGAGKSIAAVPAVSPLPAAVITSLSNITPAKLLGILSPANLGTATP